MNVIINFQRSEAFLAMTKVVGFSKKKEFPEEKIRIYSITIVNRSG